MPEQEIIEGNKLIAEFMDLMPVNRPYKGAYTTNESTESKFRYFVNSNMEDECWYVYPKFHESWDWLMPVVEKIESIDSYITTKETMQHIRLSIPDINLVYYYVVEFIKWYNTNKT